MSVSVEGVQLIHFRVQRSWFAIIEILFIIYVANRSHVFRPSWWHECWSRCYYSQRALWQTDMNDGQYTSFEAETIERIVAMARLKMNYDNNDRFAFE